MTRCEAETVCVQVCPNDVFEVRRIDDADYRGLTRLGRVRVLARGKKMAYVTADLCRACGLCVVACPQDAISLVAPRR
jgi:4Fe-4S ferredoxin